ncbi:hypothetical protein D3C71_1559440 [compost metagenome]
MHGIRRRHAEGARNNDLRPADFVDRGAAIRLGRERNDHIRNGLAGWRFERIVDTRPFTSRHRGERLCPQQHALGIVVLGGIRSAL